MTDCNCTRYCYDSGNACDVCFLPLILSFFYYLGQLLVHAVTCCPATVRFLVVALLSVVCIWRIKYIQHTYIHVHTTVFTVNLSQWMTFVVYPSVLLYLKYLNTVSWTALESFSYHAIINLGLRNTIAVLMRYTHWKLLSIIT